MITITETVELFTYTELPPRAQDKAVNLLIKAQLECPSLVPEEAQEQYDKACQDAEAMQTPWFTGEYVWDYCRVWIMAELNDCYFTQDGGFYGRIAEQGDK